MFWMVSGKRVYLHLRAKLRDEFLPWAALGLPSDAYSMWSSKAADLGSVALHIEVA